MPQIKVEPAWGIGLKKERTYVPFMKERHTDRRTDIHTDRRTTRQRDRPNEGQILVNN